MIAVLQFVGWLAILVAALPSTALQDRSDEDTKSSTHEAIPSSTVCEARTINYITHSLPQFCLTSTWRSATVSQNVSSPPEGISSAEETGSLSTDPPESSPDKTASATENLAYESAKSLANEPESSPFLSFEDWKEMMLRRTGQDPQDLRSRKGPGEQPRERTPPDLGHFGLGEDEEISLDFERYLENSGSGRPTPSAYSEQGVAGQQSGDAVVYEGDKASLHRSKDAGKTCKERFSYSSFDAGATILKTGRGTKNAKAILVENKDSYMLLECSVDNKFVIVELSDDILIDTMVLANFEFFSSMIRHFRVSVSDRYPVKLERWRDIGTFEARNSRDIQAFLVENPQIWAKYVRIEFLTQYGNEFYCPVSLLRVHGSRMLDSWKDSETGGESESLLEDELEANAIAEHAHADDREDEGSHSSEDNVASLNFTTWISSDVVVFDSVNGTCRLISSPTEELPLKIEVLDDSEEADQPSTEHGRRIEPKPSGPVASKQRSLAEEDRMSSAEVVPPTASSSATADTRQTPQSSSNVVNTTVANETSTEPSPSATKTSTSASSSLKQRSSGTQSASSASPTVQEGFFHAITKRLHHVETNLTLSLQYLDDHSRYMQEAFQKAEQKQMSKVTAFLEHLNQTVLDELRGVRDQYEQIWQSTVIALETQKEQSDRDIVALGARLNLLADEVVFQKRMAIVQAVLLLCCLFLVIFSRGVPIPYLAPLLDQNGPSTSHATTRPSRIQTTEPFRSNPLTSRLDRRQEQRPYQEFPQDFHDDNGSALLHPLLGDTINEEFASAEADEDPVSGNCDGGMRENGLSPPLTPNSSADGNVVDSASPEYEIQPPSSRRHQAYNGQGRKPLPALPEHPSPEHRP